MVPPTSLKWQELKETADREGRAKVGYQIDLWPEPTHAPDGGLDPKYAGWIAEAATVAEHLYGLAWWAESDETGSLCFWVRPLPEHEDEGR